MRNDLLTLEEAARVLGVSPKTLHSQIRTDRLRAHDLRPRVLVAKAEVMRYRRDSQPTKPALSEADFETL